MGAALRQSCWFCCLSRLPTQRSKSYFCGEWRLCHGSGRTYVHALFIWVYLACLAVAAAVLVLPVLMFPSLASPCFHQHARCSSKSLSVAAEGSMQKRFDVFCRLKGQGGCPS